MKAFKKLYQFVYHYFFYFWFTILLAIPVMMLGLCLRLYGFDAFLQRLWGWGFFVPNFQKVTIEGHTEVLKKGKPYVVIANHSSMIDIPLIATLIKTPSSWVLKDAMLKVPVAGLFFRMGGGISLPRANPHASEKLLMANVEKIRKRMNPSILIFPEGTRSPSGKPGSFKRGFIRIMRTYQMDVLPVSLIGVHDYMPVGTLWTNPDAKIKVFVHKPVPWQELTALDEKEAAARMRALITEKLPPEYR